jgi:succinate dehydrogenase/fumarate reductase flavoprotein subunit
VPQKSARSEPPFEVDIVVIGSGVTGLSAAIVAAHRGQDVVVLEKEKSLGGTTAVSGGWMWLPGNKAGLERGDTREDIESYIRAIAGDSYNSELVTAFLDSVPEVMNFFEEHTDMEFVYADTAPDYQMTAAGAREGGRAVTVTRVDGRLAGPDRKRIQPYIPTITVFGYMPEVGADLARILKASYHFPSFVYLTLRVLRTWLEMAFFGRGLVRSNGNALITRLVATAQRLQIPLRTHTGVARLVLDDNGAITGVETSEGQHIRARKGVVLAAGGFAGNADLRKKYFSHDRDGRNHQTPTVGHGGDGFLLAQEVGGVMDASPHQPAPWAPITQFKNLRNQDRVFPHLRAFGLPGLICVNERGERFANESLSYHDFCREWLKDSQGQTSFHAYIIGDRNTMRRYGMGYAKPFPVPNWYFKKIGYLTSGRSVAELAEKINVPADQLEKTLQEFNKHAVRGEDPHFQRGTTKFHHFKGDLSHKPNPNLAPINRGPFYAVKIIMGDLGTFAGLSVNGSCQVVDAQGHPITGLYAGGTAAVSVFGGAYPGFGSNIGQGLVQGYIAATELAGSSSAHVSAHSGA